MKQEGNIQHAQILDKIKSKYGSKVTLKICEHFVSSKIQGISEELSKQIMAKFVSIYGNKKQYDDSQILTLIYICIVAQRNIPFAEIEPQNFLKYKSKNLHLKTSKGKDEQKGAKRQSGEQVRKVGLVVQQPAEKPMSTSIQQPPVQILATTEIQLEPDQPKRIVVPPLPTFQQSTDIRIQPTHDTIQEEPARKFSFGSSQDMENLPTTPVQYEKSISTKMVTQQSSQYQQKNEGNADTPKFLKTDTPRFFQSQLELSTRAITPPNDRKVPQISITRYIKQTEYLSTVVRYEIKTANQEHPPVYRRYSEFLKLQTYLRSKYKGLIIPEMPPKQNLMTSLWSSSETTLQQRKKGLEQFLNKCLSHQTIGKDPLLLRFIDDQNLDESNYNQDSIMTTAQKYIASIWNITASTEQLKDYGIAYFSYIKNRQAEPDSIDTMFVSIQKEQTRVKALKEYVDKVEDVKNRRAKLEHQNTPPNGTANGKKPQQDAYKKELEKIILEFSEARKTYNEYCGLRNDKIWLEHLYGAKVHKADHAKLGEQLKDSESRLLKIAPILQKQMGSFLKDKQANWNKLLQGLCQWRLKTL